MTDLSKPYDVAVFGGGLCGFAAAIKLAGTGRRVILVERRPVLGWEATWACQLALTENASLTVTALRAELARVGGLRGDRADAPIMEMVLDRQAKKAGMDVLLYSQPVAVSVEDGSVASVTIASKAGELAVRATAFVDATENGFLWQRTGGIGKSVCGGHSKTAIQVLFLNCVQASLNLPLKLGDLGGVKNVVLQPTVWDGEVGVEFDIASPDIRIARRALPGLLEAVRTQFPSEMAKAVVTNVGVEPFPRTAAQASDGHRHPKLKNLFGAGPWAGRGDAATLAGRLAMGEAAATMIAEALRGLRPPSAAHVSAPSMAAPPVYDCDVLVCGGGTAGPFAAIAAARQGAKVMLIEPTTFLGGIGTGGGIHVYYHGVVGGIQDEADARIQSLSPLFGQAVGFHPQAKKVVLQLMADEAGVELVFDTTATGVETEAIQTRLPATGREATSRRIRGVVAAGPNGNALYRAKVVIDSTGDGDVAVMAGAPFTFGREKDNLPHAYSLPAGRLDANNGKLLGTNFDAGYCDPTDVVDLTRARRRGLEHYWREKFEAPTRLVYIAPLIGLRNSRQIIGDYCLTLGGEIVSRDFPDVIAYARSHFDNHGLDYENESDEAMLWTWTLGHWRRPIGCEIPYRALLPKGVEGLLMACRAISMTHDAHNQLRMQRDMQRLGEAAGVAAALAARQGVTPRALDIQTLQAELYKSGALGPRQRPALAVAAGFTPAGTGAPVKGAATPEVPGLASALHDPTWKPPQFPALPVQQLAEALGKEKPQEAVWPLVNAGGEAVPALRDALKSDKPQTRFWASVGLAWFGQRDAVPALVAAVRERRPDMPQSPKAAPIWHAAVVLLGRVGDASAVPTLTDVLQDKSAPLDALVAAVRALGRLGDKSAVPAIEAMLTRPDLPGTRTFQVSIQGVNPVQEDARWQLDLASAEVLAQLGRPRPDLVERHAKDPRAYVRRYAAKVAGRTQG